MTDRKGETKRDRERLDLKERARQYERRNREERGRECARERYIQKERGGSGGKVVGAMMATDSTHEE